MSLFPDRSIVRSDDAEPVGKVVNTDVPGPSGMIPVRVYYPRSFKVSKAA